MTDKVSQSSSAVKGGHKVWIGNLDHSVTEYQILKLVEPFGKILKFDFVYSLNTRGQRVPRGFAFVTYDDSDGAQKAIRNLNGVKLKGKAIAVKLSSSVGSKSESMVIGAKRSLSECRADMEKDKEKEEKAKLDKIRALEAKLRALQEEKDQFKLALPKTSDPGGKKPRL